MAKYTPKPKKVQNHTQVDEKKVFVGKRKSVDLLPNVLQTEPNKMFLDTTIDNLLSSGTTETLNTYWGRVTGKSYEPESDLYAPEYRATRLNYQLAPGVKVSDASGNTAVSSYINMLDALRNVGTDTTDHNELMSTEGQVLSLPINVDMFINYNNYYWVSTDLPICEIDATVSNPIDIDDIVAFSNYTTPILTNTKQLELLNGMRVKFTGANVSSTSGNYVINAVYLIEGVGSDSIHLTMVEDENGNTTFNHIQSYSFTVPADLGEIPVRIPNNTLKDYVVMNRSSRDRNSWSRANQWYSSHVINETATFNDLVASDYMNTETRGKRPIIEFNANMELFGAGAVTNTPVDDVEHLITDGLINPSNDIINVDIDTYEHKGVKFVVGERVMFFNTATTIAPEFLNFNNKIYTVTVDGSNRIQLILSVDPAESGNELEDDTKVLISHAQDPYVGSEWVWSLSELTWKLGQFKKFRGQSPLFNLYDINGEQITGSADEAFRGEKIWAYAESTASVLDEELGFAPKYNSQVSNDFVFEFTLNNNRYKVDVTNTYKRKIEGDYFFKNIVTGELDGCWETLRDVQHVPVILTHIATANDENIEFDLGTSLTERTTEYNLVFDNNAYSWSVPTYTGESRIDESNPTLICKYDTVYTINNFVTNSLNDIEFVDPLGNVDAAILVSTVNNVITLEITSAYPYASVRYRNNSDPSVTGMIYMSNDNHSTVRMRKNGTIQPDTSYEIVGSVLTYTSNVEVDDIFELSYVPHEKIDNAVYSVAPSFLYNPVNERINEASFTQMFGHFEEQLMSMPALNGNAFGFNSYHKVPRIHNYGGTVRRQVYSPVKLSYMIKNNSTNPFNAMVALADEYTTFKNAFINKVKQLWKTSSNVEIMDIVDNALTQINIGKSPSFKYAKSDMVYYENAKEFSHSFNGGTLNLGLPFSLNKYDDIQNHIQVWLYTYDGVSKNIWKPLSVGTDYVIDANQINLLVNSLYDGSNSNVLKVKWFNIKNVSFMPPSVVKLGFKKPTQVEMIDNKLYMHDGSVYSAKGSELFDKDSSSFDVVAAALYDLELRIFNNLGDKHYQVEDIGKFIPSENYNHGYTWGSTVNKLDDWYNRWASRNVIESGQNINNLFVQSGFSDPSYYDGSDAFTWNYSSVFPNIGGWEGIYNYYFGTSRPHTAPWEMLGHRVKPTWWDANYDWTDVTVNGKRDSLINALKNGIVGDPSLDGTRPIQDLRYARTGYDWDNDVLVTTALVLNDPITANVVATPSSVNASSDFEFGDWGQYEQVWRNTSNYQFAIFETLLQLKPFLIFETFWNIADITTNTNGKHQIKYMRSSSSVTPLSEVEDLHASENSDGFISEVIIKNGGTGHTSESTAEILAGSISQAEIRLFVTGGEIVSAVVENPGKGYNVDSPVNVTSAFGNDENLVAYIDTTTSLPKMGINNVVVEWSKLYGISSDDLSSIVTKITPQLMLHLGGYSDKNILDLVVDTSLNGGRVSIPSQDFTISLDSGLPVRDFFYSGVTVTKNARGYSVSGFNNLNRKFEFHMPSTGGKFVSEAIGSTTVERYIKFKDEKKTIPYGHVFPKRQELFNFLNGLGEIYSRAGFDVAPQWIIDGKKVLTWSLTAENGDTISINGISDKLVYAQGNVGFVQNVDVIYDGIKNVFDQDGRSISSEDLFVLRDYETTEFSTKDVNSDIYGLHVNIVEFEHVINISNTTQFNDTVFNPVIGIAIDRIKVEGERTRNWNGRVEAPGYIVREDGISTNFESNVREVERDIVNTESKSLNRSTRQTSRFNVGYNQPTYLSETFVEDNTSYGFSKGVRKYKGTTTAIDAFAKNKGLFGTSFDYTINEEWMIRMGDYGDKQRRNPIEIEVNPDLIKASPQIIKFNDYDVVDRSGDSVIDIGINDYRLITSYSPEPFNLLPMRYSNNETLKQSKIFNSHFKTSGLPLLNEVSIKLKSVDDLSDAFDPEATYAQISNWENNVSYKLGDQKRYGGKAYEAIVGNTGLNVDYNPIVLTGTVSGASVASTDPNLFLIIDDQIINFYRTETNTTYSVASVTGNIVNPTTPSGTTMVINGTDLTFNKSETVTTYNNIVFSGLVTNPTITGDTGSLFTVDTYTIDFAAFEQTSENITAKIAVESAFVDAGMGAAQADTLSTTRITAFNDLRTAYIAEFDQAAWTTFLQGYFASTTEFETVGYNVVYLQAELAAASGLGYEIHLQALLQNDIDVINQLRSTSYTIASTGIDADISLTITEVSAGTYISEYTSELLTGSAVSLNTTVIVVYNDTGIIKIWTLPEIVDHLNNTLNVSNITASASTDNRLVLTKVPTVGDTSMTITDSDTGATDLLTEVGIVAETKNSTGTDSIVLVELALSDIINQINSSGLPNVSASASSNQLVISASDGDLTIGSGSANTNVGIVEGVYIRSEVSETTIPVTSQIFNIVDAINDAAIAGVTAQNISNNVVITSTNPTLDIGEGSANPFIGIEAGLLSATTINNNTWDFAEWRQITDPAVFNIWVSDDSGYSGVTTRFDGYNVYQVFDFNIELDHVCAGLVNTDNALVKPMSNVSVEAGDYVMIVGSQCTPSVDGIHTITEVDAGNEHFFIDEFIEEKGNGGKMFIIRPVRFKTDTELFATNGADGNDTLYYADGGESGWQPNMLAFVDNVNNTGIGATYEVVASTVDGVAFRKIRDQIAKVDNNQIKNVVIYNPNDNTTKATVEIFDPAKGILPGVVMKEINYIQDSDSAVYNNSTDLSYSTNNSNFWSDNIDNAVWWDISNAVYLDYEQEDVDYTQANWAKLYPTATIDVYEWTKSPVPPEEYVDAVSASTVIDNVVLTGTPYTKVNGDGDTDYYWSEEVIFDTKTNTEQTYYFFWVKDKTTVPNNERQYSTTQLSALIEDPVDFGISWAAAANSRTILINALERYLDFGSDVVQINFASESVNHHQEYALLAENDPTLTIPEWLHYRMRDSVAGYDLGKKKTPYTDWNINTSYVLGDVVKFDGKFYIANVSNNALDPAINSSQGYIEGELPWTELLNVTDNPNGVTTYINIPLGYVNYSSHIIENYIYFGTPIVETGTLVRTEVNFVEYDAPNVVPDYNLHELNRYGNEIRPKQSWFKDITEARRTLIEVLNAKLLTINLINSTLNWDILLQNVYVDGLYTQEFSTLWTWVDWKSDDYVDVQPDFFVSMITDLGTLTPLVGQYATVQTSSDSDDINREAIYKYTNNGWELVWKQKATIKFLDILWDYVGNDQGWSSGGWNNGVYNFDPASLLSSILDTVRDNIFVGQYQPLYNELWFAMLNYSLGEQRNLDWAIKSSYVKMAINLNINEQYKKFIRYRDDLLIDYINEVKPFHTKLRDVVLNKNLEDKFDLTFSELSSVIGLTQTFSEVNPDNTVWTDLTVDGNDNNSGDVDFMEFTTSEPSIEFLYDGGDFEDAPYYTNDSEYIPTSLNESLEIRVHTNPSGATETVDSKSFRMFYGRNNMYEAAVINTQTTLTSGIDSTTTEIPVANGSLLWTPTLTKNGVVWIGSERIEYTHIFDNTLYNCVRGTGGTSAQDHASTDIVYEGGTPSIIPTQKRLVNYGDNLRPAFNDFGKSITDATSVSPEAVFVYDNG